MIFGKDNQQISSDPHVAHATAELKANLETVSRQVREIATMN